MKYVFLDLETTGFSPETDSILEIAYRVYEHDLSDHSLREIKHFQSLVLFDGEISDEVIDITGITQELLWREGRAWTTLADQIQADLKDGVIVGHNISFDTSFLRAQNISLSGQEIDTFPLAQLLYSESESLNLGFLAERLGFKNDTEHRAMSDVDTNVKLFEHMVGRLREFGEERLSVMKVILSQSQPFPTTDFLLSFCLNSSGTDLDRLTEEYLSSSATENNAPLEAPTESHHAALSARYVQGAASLDRWDYLVDDATKRNLPCLISLPTVHHTQEFLRRFSSAHLCTVPSERIDPRKIAATLRSGILCDELHVLFLLKACLALSTAGEKAVFFSEIKLFSSERMLRDIYSMESDRGDASRALLVTTHDQLPYISGLSRGRICILDDAPRYLLRAGSESERLLTENDIAQVESTLQGFLGQDYPHISDTAQRLAFLARGLFRELLAITHPPVTQPWSRRDNAPLPSTFFAQIRELLQRNERFFQSLLSELLASLESCQRPDVSLIRSLANRFSDVFTMFEDLSRIAIFGTLSGGGYRLSQSNEVLRAALHSACAPAEEIILSGYDLTSLDDGRLVSDLTGIVKTETVEIDHRANLQLSSHNTPNADKSVLSDSEIAAFKAFEAQMHMKGVCIFSAKVALAAYEHASWTNWRAIFSQLSMPKHRLYGRFRSSERAMMRVTAALLDDSGLFADTEQVMLQRLPFFVPTDRIYLERFQVPNDAFLTHDLVALSFRIGAMIDLFPGATWSILDERIRTSRWGSVLQQGLFKDADICPPLRNVLV